MTERAGTAQADGGQRRLALIAPLTALAAFALLQIAAAAKAGWVFEYPLDDPYIHLAIASQIARGGYGVNAGEIASAASSILYPFLLTPFPDTALQRLLPLIWNAVGIAAASLLWTRILIASGYRGAPATALAILGPLAFGILAAAFTGMEHALHTAASLAIVSGLLRFIQTGRAGPLLFAGILLSPLLRFEGLALALAAAAVIAACGQRWQAALALALAVLPAAAFCAALAAAGLDPLPSSVLAKVAIPGMEDASLPARLLVHLQLNLHSVNGAALGILTLLSLILSRGLPCRRGWLGLAGAAAGAAHLLFGQIGWVDRYEVYALLTLAAIVLALAAGRGRAILAAALIPMAISGAYYTRETLTSYWRYPRAIHLQQAQMARFAQDFADLPVAVNDLGRVAWGNRNYVLDLWGLADPRVRVTRLAGVPGWAGQRVREAGVPLILVYDNWVDQDGDPDWIRLGTLHMNDAYGFLGSDDVAFYAADPATAASLRPKLEEFRATLPKDAVFTPR